MDLKDILAALERWRAPRAVRGILSEGEEAYWRAPQSMQRNKRIEPTPEEPTPETMATLVRNWAVARKIHLERPTKTLFLRLASESWTRPAGILSASGFDIIVMDAEWAFEKSVEDFGAAEWRAVAMFLGSVIDNPSKRGKGRPREPFREALVYQKPRGAPVMYDESYCRLMVQAIDAVKAEMPGLRTDTAAIEELFKRQGRRRSATDVANLGRRLSEWRLLPGK